MDDQHWIELSQDADTGIESIRAHFQGHAYDPHWHDSFLVGVTEQGVQQFNCRRMKHLSTPGKVFMLEPGEIHDGHAPTEEGFGSTLALLSTETQLAGKLAKDWRPEGLAVTLSLPLNSLNRKV